MKKRHSLLGVKMKNGGGEERCIDIIKCRVEFRPGIMPHHFI